MHNSMLLIYVITSLKAKWLYSYTNLLFVGWHKLNVKCPLKFFIKPRIFLEQFRCNNIVQGVLLKPDENNKYIFCNRQTGLIKMFDFLKIHIFSYFGVLCAILLAMLHGILIDYAIHQVNVSCIYAYILIIKDPRMY